MTNTTFKFGHLVCAYHNDGIMVLGVTNTGIKDLTIPNLINGYTVTAIGPNAFRNCFNLTYVTLPNTLIYINKYAFANCVSLQTIVIPDSVLYMGEGVFSTCTKLLHVTLSNQLGCISSGMFVNCCNLDNVLIPDSVKSIRECAFSGCTKLKKFNISVTTTDIHPDTFGHRYTLKYLTVVSSFETTRVLVDNYFNTIA